LGGNTEVTVRHKQTGVVSKISLSDLYADLKD